MALDRKLPEGISCYAKTDLYTVETVPEKLVNHHNLKSGTWGVLAVEAGTVKYFLEHADEPLAVIGAGEVHIVLPEERHFVRLSDDARFYVAFHK